MGRTIKCCTRTLTSVTVDANMDLGDWVVENAPETAVTLLVFSLDGLIWGELESGALTTSHDVAPDYSPALHRDTLQEARLFGKTAELHIWRANNELHAQIITDDLNGKEHEYIDESQILWGNHAESIGESGFSLMSDGVQGLFHAVPLSSTKNSTQKDGGYRPLRLQVRHYLVDGDFGQARIGFSRLVELTAVAQGEN